MTGGGYASGNRHVVLGMRVDPTSYEEATAAVCEWAQAGQSRCVSVANVHMVMEAYDDPAFREIINASYVVTPDGVPLVWMLRLGGHRAQQRVYGPTLMLKVCEAAVRLGIAVGFYGGRPEVLYRLVGRLRERYPDLNVACAISPPFRTLLPQEDAAVVADINASGARILFVGLGCPRQERWIVEHKDQINSVMLGVGAAFDFHAGALRQAPTWMQNTCLAWLFRLAVEPRRLWKRYLKHNPRFVFLALKELVWRRAS